MNLRIIFLYEHPFNHVSQTFEIMVNGPPTELRPRGDRSRMELQNELVQKVVDSAEKFGKIQSAWVELDNIISHKILYEEYRTLFRVGGLVYNGGFNVFATEVQRMIWSVAKKYQKERENG